MVEVGDEILSINKTPVSKTDDVIGLLAKTGQTLILSIYRKGKLLSYVFAIRKPSCTRFTTMIEMSIVLQDRHIPN